MDQLVPCSEVFYAPDPTNENKKVVVPGKHRIVGVDNVEDEDEYNQYDQIPFFVHPEKMKLIEARLSYSGEMPYLRTDCEGKLVNR